VLMVRIWKSHF